jgi:hypothetical protein
MTTPLCVYDVRKQEVTDSARHTSVMYTRRLLCSCLTANQGSNRLFPPVHRTLANKQPHTGLLCFGGLGVLNLHVETRKVATVETGLMATMASIIHTSSSGCVPLCHRASTFARLAAQPSLSNPPRGKARLDSASAGLSCPGMYLVVRISSEKTQPHSRGTPASDFS